MLERAFSNLFVLAEDRNVGTTLKGSKPVSILPPGENNSLWRRTEAPASRSASATACRPKHSSISSETVLRRDFAADRFVDLDLRRVIFP